MWVIHLLMVFFSPPKHTVTLIMFSDIYLVSDCKLKGIFWSLLPSRWQWTRRPYPLPVRGSGQVVRPPGDVFLDLPWSCPQQSGTACPFTPFPMPPWGPWARASDSGAAGFTSGVTPRVGAVARQPHCGQGSICHTSGFFLCPHAPCCCPLFWGTELGA